MLLHWWRRLGLLPRDGFEVGERLQRFRDLTAGDTLRVDVRFAEPSEKVRPKKPWWLRELERKKIA